MAQNSRPLRIQKILAINIFMVMILSFILVYMTEIMPTKNRGTASGVIITVARLAYIFGPLLAGVLLSIDPAMDYYWLAGGISLIIPLVFVMIAKPMETQGKTIETIEAECKD